jgi:choline/glycine/proline betaine transport protein
MAESDETTGEMSDGLQVELFHPDSDREPGDTNIQRFGFDIHPVVFPVALVSIALFIFVTIILGDQAASMYTALFNFIG